MADNIKYKLVALDMDRTTLNIDGYLSDGNRKAIKAAIANGVHVCIASGRAFDTLPKDVVSIEGLEYAVTGNGAAIYSIENKKCLHSFLLEESSVRKIIEIVKNYPVKLETFVKGKAYAAKDYFADPVKYGANEKSIEYIHNTRTPKDDIVQFMLEHSKELDSIDIVVDNLDMKQEITDEIKENVEDVYITSSISHLIEISYKDAGKKSGVKYLADMLKIDRKQIAAFGDGDNDIDMIEYAGCGIAMANASENLLKAADFVTLHHNEDGVAYGFKNILKIC